MSSPKEGPSCVVCYMKGEESLAKRRFAWLIGLPQALWLNNNEGLDESDQAELRQLAESRSLCGLYVYIPSASLGRQTGRRRYLIADS